jgi:integrase
MVGERRLSVDRFPDGGSMSPVRTSKAGCFRFDRDFTRLGVGRIQRSSGTRVQAEFRRRDAILTKLAENAEIEILQAFNRGDIAIEQLVEADRKGNVRFTLADLQLRQPLWSAAEATLNDLTCSESTRKRYVLSIAKLKRRAADELPQNARIADLLEVRWLNLRNGWGGSAADWNHMRRATSVVLSSLLGDKYHPFRRKLMALIPKANEGKGRVPDLTPEMFLAVVHAMPAYARACPMVLAATGMRTGEYLSTTREHLKPGICAIAVPGTKTAGSNDFIHVDEKLWPWIEAGVPSPLKYKWLRVHWTRACVEVGVAFYKDPANKRGYVGPRLHDLRHCHGQWAVNNGASEASVQVALRHATPEMTRRYTTSKNKGEVARVIGNVLCLESAS